MKNLDFFGEPVRILLNKNYSIQTTIGGYLTILTGILSLVFTWFIGRDLIYKEKPISYMQKDIYTTFQKISLNKTNFQFSFTLMDDNNAPLFDYSYLTLKIHEIKYRLNPVNGTFDLISKNVKPVKFCNYSDYPLITPQQFDAAQLQYTICPENFFFNLYGYWNENDLNYLEITVERCMNKTNNNTDSVYSRSEILCKTPHEIEAYISQTGANLNIFYIDSRVRINNNTNPIEFLSSINYKYIIPNYFKKTVFKIQSQSIKTDNGFIFSETEDKKYFKMVEDFSDLRLIDPLDYKFLVFEIYSSNFSETFFRRYIKIPDILASLGGILKIFTIAFLMLNKVFSEVEKNISIVNEVFVLNKKGNKGLPIIGQHDFKIDNRDNKINNPILLLETKSDKNKVLLKNNFIILSKTNFEESNCKEKDRFKTSSDIPIANKVFKSNEKEDPQCLKALEATKTIFHFNNEKNNSENFNNIIHENDNFNILNENDNCKKIILKNDNFNNIIHENDNSKNINILENDKCNNIIHENDNFNNNDINILKSNKTQKKERHQPGTDQTSSNRYLRDFQDDKLDSYISQYINLRKSKTKLSFGLCGILSIIWNRYCKKKIPKRMIENFKFYEKARCSVTHYFDFIFMIKKFEEINLLKECLLTEEQLKMVELLSKPILSSKNVLLSLLSKKARNIDNLIHAADFSKVINDFNFKLNKYQDEIDYKIFNIIEENVKKSYV